VLKTIIRYATLAAMLLMLAGGGAACGKKGPPLPPGHSEPPVVTDLRYRIVEDGLSLEWSIPDSGKDGAYDIAGARVLRFKAPAANAPCSGCPLNLSLAADIPFESRDMQYKEILEKDHVYAYQVILYDQAGQEGGKSKRVEFVHE
jgi:hypothetical protein